MPTLDQVVSDEILDALEDLTQTGTPGPQAAPLFDVGTQKFLSFFEREILDELVGGGGATCRFFEGPYGAGKTHVLSLIQHLARRREMPVVKTTLSEHRKLEDWRAVTVHVLESIELCIDGETAIGLPGVLQLLARAGIADPDAVKRAKLPHAGFKEAILHVLRGSLPSAPAREKLTRYLRGERIGAGELKRLGVDGVKNPLSARNAEQVLNTVVNALYLMGASGTVLLFDETEQAFQSNRYPPPRKVQVGANVIRHFVDACASGDLVGVVAVFAVLPGFLSNCAESYPALGDRLLLRRRGNEAPGWRSPVLPLAAVTTVQSPEQFLEDAIRTFCGVLERCGTRPNGTAQAMRRAGQQVLGREAGAGYRRPLIKSLAQIAYDKLDA